MTKPPRDTKPPTNPKPNGPTSGEYAVGYKKPPAHSRFKPGNKAAKGRRRSPPADIDFAGDLERVLLSTVEVKIDGKLQRRTKAAIVLEQYVNNLMKNPSTNHKYLKELMELLPERTSNIDSAEAVDTTYLRARIDQMAERQRDEEAVRLRAEAARTETSAGDDSKHPD
jgi:hypothetical protein